jgi:hypothetical protein
MSEHEKTLMIVLGSDSDDHLLLKDRNARLLSCEEVLSVDRNRKELNVLAEVSMDGHVGMERRKRGPPFEMPLDSRKVFQPQTFSFCCNSK